MNDKLTKYMAVIKDVCENPASTHTKEEADALFLEFNEQEQVEALAALFQYGADLMAKAAEGGFPVADEDAIDNLLN
jgi:hypothetical protein